MSDKPLSGGKYMSPLDVEREFLIPIPTQNVWRYLNRYGWRNLTIKLGRKVAYRRSDIESWVESRRMNAYDPKDKSTSSD